MGLTDQLKSMATNMQQSARNASISTAQRILRLISGFFIALVLGFVVQELTTSGDLMLVFMIILFTGIIYKLLSRLQIFQILIFDLICVLVAALLRMYIMIAP